MAEKTEIVVRVARDWDGQIYSEVWDKSATSPSGYTKKSVVIDRAKGRSLDQETVKHRAKALSELLCVPFEEDYQWPCATMSKRPCRCPKCVEAGR